MKLSIDRKTDILIALFVAALVAANLLGTKIVTLLGISFSVGIFAYPLTFLVTDVIAEVHGKQKAKNLVYAGFTAILVILILTLISLALPPADRYAANEAYLTVFGTTWRIILASLIAFMISQMHDVWAFEFWKTKTNGRFLWLRNNASTVISQLLDTTIFMFIAFYGVTPKFDVAFIISLIIPYWLLKIAVALFDTPIVYIGVRWLKGEQKKAS
ncbi:MAG: queuosine precursor transporter [Patescibacteria group bacterium]